jgi:hypothetical protein
MSILQSYIEGAANQAPLMGALDFAKALMAGDPASLKAGYTSANAYIATVEQANRECIAIDKIALAGCLGIPRGEAIRLLGMVR